MIEVYKIMRAIYDPFEKL